MTALEIRKALTTMSWVHDGESPCNQSEYHKLFDTRKILKNSDIGDLTICISSCEYDEAVEDWGVRGVFNMWVEADEWGETRSIIALLDTVEIRKVMAYALKEIETFGVPVHEKLKEWGGLDEQRI